MIHQCLHCHVNTFFGKVVDFSSCGWEFCQDIVVFFLDSQLCLICVQKGDYGSLFCSFSLSSANISTLKMCKIDSHFLNVALICLARCFLSGSILHYGKRWMQLPRACVIMVACLIPKLHLNFSSLRCYMLMSERCNSFFFSPSFPELLQLHQQQLCAGADRGSSDDSHVWWTYDGQGN